MKRPTKMARKELANLKAEYQASGNPMWIWCAYRVARECALPCPAWVMKYVDTSAAALLANTDPSTLPKKRGIAPAIVKAFGFAPSGRRRKHNPFDLGERDLAIADCIYLRVTWEGEKLLYAYKFASEKFKVSEATAARAWASSKHLVPWRSAGEPRWRTAQKTRPKKRLRAISKK